jgi:hypothetical protein
MALDAELPLPIAPGTAQQGDYQTLDVPFYPNEEPEWCWAACGQMMGSLLLGKLIDQCTFASTVFPNSNCCANKSACNTQLPIDGMSKVFALIGKKPDLVSSDISFAELQTEIGQKRLPVQVGFKWDGSGGGHVAVICGFSTQNNDQQVYINDPIYGCGWIEFSNLKNAYGHGTWQWTWKLVS